MPQWFYSRGDSLSDEQIASLERVLLTNPDDTCSRGYLIAHGQGRVPRRIDHVLWMIEHRPEWEGFLLNLSRRGYSDAQGATDRVRDAWLRQVGADQQRGMALHNAAVFFAESDPDFAVELMERAVRLEPDVLFHVEGLGNLYGRSQGLPGINPLFVARARSVLLSSTDRLVVAGALNAIRPFSNGMSDLGRLLLARLGELAGDRTPNELLQDLPSRAARYRDPHCPLIPLLRKCVDTLVP